MSAIHYQSCTVCGDQWALARTHCRRCGGDIIRQASTGRGTIFSVTTQHRAPHKDFPETAPWNIALIDLDEGVRIMGRLEDNGQIGARVSGQMKPFGGAMVPSFNTKEEE
ncbi:MAG: Zn-ribbon domain-containing OB-fold protein [Paracoccaceae bacterium]